MKSKAIGRAVWYLKYRNADDVARPLGDLLAAAAGAAGIAGDVIVPVPLHPSRLRRRGYNQADLIARRISAVSALPCLQALSRTRNTKSQLSTGNRMGRFANMQNAFTVALPDAIRGKHVLLVDDVATTGATLGAAAHALQDAGATRVTALAVARG
jgi:ComF family protein